MDQNVIYSSTEMETEKPVAHHSRPYPSDSELVSSSEALTVASSNYSLGKSGIRSEKMQKKGRVNLPALPRKPALTYRISDVKSKGQRSNSSDNGGSNKALKTFHSNTEHSSSESVTTTAIIQNERKEAGSGKANGSIRSDSPHSTVSFASSGGKRPDSTHILQQQADGHRPYSRRVSSRHNRLASWNWKKKKQSWKDVPVSMEKIQRKVLVNTNQVRQDVKNFRVAYIHKVNDIAAVKWKVFAEEALRYLHLDEQMMQTPQDFQLVLSDRDLDNTNLKKKVEHEQLETVCSKAVHFENLIRSSKECLQECKQHYLDNYLISFADEQAALEIQCVRNYEQNIQTYRFRIDAGFEKLDKLYREYKDIQHPFISSFLPRVATWSQQMNSCCVTIMDICEVIRRWCQEDRMYPKKLWDESINGNMRRGHLVEDMKKLQRKHEELAHSISRKEAARDRMLQKTEDIKRDQRKAQASLEVVTEKTNRILSELKSTQSEFNRNQNLIKNRKSNSPALFELLWKKSDQIKEQLDRLEAKLEVEQRHQNRLQMTALELDQSVRKLEWELTAQETTISMLRVRLEDMEKEVDMAHGDMQQCVARITAAKNIRDLKLSPVTLRRIHFQRTAIEGEQTSCAHCC